MSDSKYAVSNVIGEIIATSFTLTALRDGGYLSDEESKFSELMDEALNTAFGEEYVEDFVDSDLFPHINLPTDAWDPDWTDDDEEE